jgi:hypothetical protein
MAPLPCESRTYHSATIAAMASTRDIAAPPIPSTVVSGRATNEKVQGTSQTRTILPASISAWSDPFILVATIVLTYLLLSRSSLSTLQLALAIIVAATVVMVALEWRHARIASTAVLSRQFFKHAALSVLGIYVGFGVTLLAWFTISEYQNAYYVPFFQALPLFIVGTIVLGALAVFAAEYFLGGSAHGGYQLGLLLLGRRREVDWRIMRDDLMTWFVRGFFLPLNFSSTVLLIDAIRGRELSLLSGPWYQSEFYIIVMMNMVIAAAVTPGYIFGWRLIRTHTTAVSYRAFDWMVTLACYLPFGLAISRWISYVPNSPSPEWMDPWVVHLESAPALMFLIGGIILCMQLIHLWGEAQFGLRSSNLSNRGIITTGAYRFTKHPVYVAKCVGWFFVWMPFVSGISLLDNLRLTVLFGATCALYLARALAEERLLSNDPVYVAYARWIDEHGIFRRLGHYIPPLRYAWRLAYWQRSGSLKASETLHHA